MGDNKIVSMQKKALIVGILVLFCIGTILPNISAVNLKNNNIDDFQDTIQISSDTFEYLIVTSRYFENSYFQNLLDYKSQYLTTKMFFVEDIYSNSDYGVFGQYGDVTNELDGNPFIPVGKEVTANFDLFDDEQAQIRNFLRFAYLNWNTRYVLLGGDAHIIPAKKLRINETWWYTGTGTYLTFANIRSDLYYAALDGTWNCDFDEFFGEASDYSTDEEADFEAELYIGRAPVDDKRDVEIFVEKVISFETSEKPENLFFVQAGLNTLNDPDSTVVPENCYQHVPEHYAVYKLYQTVTSVTMDKYVNNWKNPDKLIVLHVGSGEKFLYYLQRSTISVEFTTDDVDRLDNPFYPVHMSVSCNSGNFGLDHDCLAEEMLLYPNGGPSACIFNSFYGVASEDDAHKYSGEFIEAQFYEIFKMGTEKLGEIVIKSKYHFTDKAEDDLLYRWCYYTVYLLGDPETSLFEVRNYQPVLDEVFVDTGYNPGTPGWEVTHFDNIEDAINSVSDSGIVNVYSGNYYENLEISKPVSLIGENKDTTHIIGDGTGDVIRFFDEVTITGFTIRNSGSGQNDAGIKVSSDLNIIKDCELRDSKFGIKIESVDENQISNNNFINNQENTYDLGDNKWFGNYFDDYTGVDDDGDGIGDYPYTFSNAKDYCPFIVEDGWLSGTNHAPIKPHISGPLTGKPGIAYSYDFLTADPDGDKVYYYIDMGDGAYDEWSGPFTSSEIKNILYYYEEKGTYYIRTKARDSNNAESDWNSCTVQISKSKQYETPFFTRLLQLFPKSLILLEVVHLYFYKEMTVFCYYQELKL